MTVSKGVHNKISAGFSLRFSLLAALAATLFAPHAHADQTLDKINSRHEIAVGVMIAGSPFGSLDPQTQQPRGMNVDLANDIGKRLGVKVQLVSVLPSTRVQFLQQGKVDILIANMEYNAQRGEILDHVPTPYYRVGGTAITPNSSGIAKWEDLRGKPVCISQGSSYIRPVVEKYGAIPRAFPGASQSLLALRGGSCVAAVHDAAPLLYPLQQHDPEWRDYRTLQPELEPAPSVIWVRQGEKDTAAKLDAIVRDWHRTGWLIEDEAKNGLTPASPALAEWHKQLPSVQ
ncbi:transporter substrate-binding domain-containing protein [Paraburkholderia silvatlantica]|uniref:Amino acid ABC transporter substrate-binding protein (PAAT family) n=1 Tax=Paraburkholderia silvatlantica TaxID=321895 RepID=A0A2V4TT28_9BURK|nr:transporter substrate-binding domain-containing protein [Paraburkholderia silvatlantica]PYE21734.1 amino acid ABC transporter substrate-binding protein (PAAT family) [Paraburkholderia silvatlantica]TDQ86856.1 amino acid ABC transporter substrate-binding protein (PAAT family) [Paraburkholderia silvatlantica]